MAKADDEIRSSRLNAARFISLLSFLLASAGLVLNVLLSADDPETSFPFRSFAYGLFCTLSSVFVPIIVGRHWGAKTTILAVSLGACALAHSAILVRMSSPPPEMMFVPLPKPKVHDPASVPRVLATSRTNTVAARAFSFHGHCSVLIDAALSLHT